MNYTCPFCGHHTTITDPNQNSMWYRISIAKPTLGDVGFGIFAVTCPNKECQQLALSAELTGAYFQYGDWKKGTTIYNWQLLPESEAKVLPDYIPKPIKEDYYEACRIRDLSAKASATLSRRCLQGMIRDFWKISKTRLKDEIEALQEKVDPDTWSSIDAVRSIGNIGAHMEKDINIMVDVESGEAQLLIGLVEQLVDDWYVDRDNRRKRSEAIKALAQAKENVKKNGDGYTVSEQSAT